MATKTHTDVSRLSRSGEEGDPLLSLARARESNQREHAIPRAARVRGTRLIRPPFPAALEGLEERGRGKVNLLALTLPSPASGRGEKPSASAVGTAALCPSRAPFGRGEQAEDQSRSDRRQEAGKFAAVHGRTVSKPRSLLAKCAGRTPAHRGREGVLFFLVTFFWTSKRKSLGR